MERFLLSLCLLAACSPQPSGGGEREPQLLRLVATDLAFEAPVTVASGLTRVRLVNHGRVWHAALISRLPEGAGVANYLSEARSEEAFPVQAIDIGGPGQTAAADSSEVVLHLPPGRYAIVCWSDDHVKSGMIVPLTVTGSSGPGGAASFNGSDGTVVLQDFRFVHTAPFRRGPQILRVRNEGQRPHNLQLYRLHPGRTLRDFSAWYRSRQGTPPAVPMGGMETMASGREGWLLLNLPPGRYFIACGTPEGDVIHAQMGMIEEFDIS